MIIDPLFEEGFAQSKTEIFKSLSEQIFFFREFHLRFLQQSGGEISRKYPISNIK